MIEVHVSTNKIFDTMTHQTVIKLSLRLQFKNLINLIPGNTMPNQHFYNLWMLLFGFWVFWLWENLNCTFWTISTSKLISIKEKSLHVGGRIVNDIHNSTYSYQRNFQLFCLDYFSSRWFFVTMVYCPGGFSRMVFCMDGIFPGGL